MAHEVDPTYFDPMGVDPQQAADVARWRKGQRSRLLDHRAAMTVEARGTVAGAIARHLDIMLAARFGSLKGRIVSCYWPIKAEFDLRFWMEQLSAAGARIALPVVETRAAPLVFRAWSPGAAMERGFWNILVPASDAAQVEPEIMLSPLVGWDGEGYRLGYGGGYFDRTLAAARAKPFVIGVGLQGAQLATIYPQPHDIPMDAIVTEAGVQYQVDRDGR
ncbi:5-formyltetrahydrofolate cyclo-ligase [Rhodobacteraceae bacterium NNCM2]|nr:5-formyltetrahydrofolate cyclo-ligase [Coraliihabitans acroporae]